MAAERRHGICHGRRQTSIIFDRVLIKGVALRGVQIERAMKIHCAPRLAISDQRNGDARSVAACEGGDSPRRKPRIRPDIIDPTSFAGPNCNAGWTLTCFRLSPRDLDALQVIETVSRPCHRPNGLLDIIFAVTNPGQPKLTSCRENVANGLQQLLLALSLKERTVALGKSPQSPVEPVQNLLVGFALLLHGHSSHRRSAFMGPHKYSPNVEPIRDRALCWPMPSRLRGPGSCRTPFPECVTCRR